MQQYALLPDDTTNGAQQRGSRQILNLSANAAPPSLCIWATGIFALPDQSSHSVHPASPCPNRHNSNIVDIANNLSMPSSIHHKFSRILDVIIGFTLLIVSVWIIIDVSLAERTIVLAISIALLVVGLVRFTKSFLVTQLDTKARITKGAVGIAVILLSMAAVLFRDLTVTFIVTMMAFAIMLVGLSRIIVGYVESELAKWARVLYVVGGIVIFCFGFLAALFPGVGFYTLVLLLSAAMMTVGIIRIVGGITGELR
ncbi:MAG: HdeD family acid-resistance protein [Promethearchaeota archaeon]